MHLPARRSPHYRHRSALWYRVRYRANILLSLYPRVLQSTKLFWRIGRLISKESKKNLAIFIGTLQGGYLGANDVDRVWHVDPRSIVYCTLREFPVNRYKEQVIRGDWDLLEKKFQDLDIHAAFSQVLLEGKDWSETIFYQRTLKDLQKGIMPWGCRNREELD